MHLYPYTSIYSAPVGAPQHPTAISLGPTSIHLTWDPPELEDHNGEIVEYRINVTEAQTGLMFDYVSNITQITITGLHPYYIYHCTIVAVTVAEGPISTTVTAVTDEAGKPILRVVALLITNFRIFELNCS